MCAISDPVEGLVSVLLPVRNGMRYLDSLLQNLGRQSHPCFEIIAVDDGSDDGTGRHLRSLNDPRLRVFETGADRRTGIVAALNLGLVEARGALIARQDVDDLSHPDRLLRQAGFLQDHSDVDVVATCADFIDDSGEKIETAWTQDVRRLHDPAQSPAQLRSLLPLTCCIVHGSVMARTSVLRAAGGYRTAYEWAEDYDLWLRLLPEHSFAKLPERLYTYRIHQGQVSTHKRVEQVRRVICAKLEYLRRVAPELPVPARIVIVGRNFGAGLYRQLAAEYELMDITCAGDEAAIHRLDIEEACADAWDVLIVADFALLDTCAQGLAQISGLRWRREGNFFIRLRDHWRTPGTYESECGRSQSSPSMSR